MTPSSTPSTATTATKHPRDEEEIEVEDVNVDDQQNNNEVVGDTRPTKKISSLHEEDDKASISSPSSTLSMIDFFSLANLTSSSIIQPCDCSGLVKLDIPNCNLSTLPKQFPIYFPNLSILFAPNNQFAEVPEIVGQCQKLQMISFKNNRLQKIHPDALQPQLRWLILTGNQLTTIPTTIGRCNKLQKLMLSGNRLTCIPEEIQNCTKLELVRLACNQLQEVSKKSNISLRYTLFELALVSSIQTLSTQRPLRHLSLSLSSLQPPRSLLKLPNLCWVGLSNNPFLKEIVDSKTKQQQHQKDGSLQVIDDPILTKEDWPILGQGAGGVTRKVTWTKKDEEDEETIDVAVKTYIGELTSDGSPQDERTISVAAALAVTSSEEQDLSKELEQKDATSPFSITAEPSSCIISLLGETTTGALIMEYLHGYDALAGPPSFETCSRDVYTKYTNCMSWENVWYTITGLLQVLRILHSQGICHGDFYSHNILINNDQDTKEYSVKLSDFGAAFFYDRANDYAQDVERCELRAFSILMEELQDQVWNKKNDTNGDDDNGNNDDEDDERETNQFITLNDLIAFSRLPTSTFDSLWNKVQDVSRDSSSRRRDAPVMSG